MSLRFDSDIATHETGDRALAGEFAFSMLAWAIIAATFAVSVDAALELRGLFADGGYYLLNLIDTQGFWLHEPARYSVQVAQQLPTVIAMRLGVRDVGMLALVFSLSLQLLPLVLLVACYFVLPARHKIWFLLPLLHFLAGTTSAAFPSIVEGPVAVSYFWVLFYVILFRAKAPFSLAVTMLAAIPALLAHEVMVLLAPLLVAAATCRASRVESRGAHIALGLLALWFAFVTVVSLRFVLHPRDAGNRDGAVRETLDMTWLATVDGQVNVPAALGLVAIISMFVIWLIGLAGAKSGKSVVSDRWSAAVTAAFGLVCAAAIFATFHLEWLVAPSLQFRARHYPGLLSTLLATFALGVLRWARLRAEWARKPTLATLALLAVGTLSWHVIATTSWTDYVRVFRAALAYNQGLVPYENVLASLSGARRARFEAMNWHWTNPTLSLLLAPGGKVSAIIANPAKSVWQPFNPSDPDALPRAASFDTTTYLEARKQPSIKKD